MDQLSSLLSKYKWIVIVVALVLSYALGRYNAPIKTITETKVVEVEKKKVDEHKDTTTTVIKHPDGTTETVTHSTDDKHTDDQTSISKDITKEVINSSGKLAISLLGGANVTNWASGPVYGLAVSKSVLGPITGGLWGLSNGTGGVSVGLNF